MSVKPCNIRIPSGLSDAQVAADAACAAKRYAYSAEQVESRLNSYVDDLTGLDLEQIAANTAAAAEIVERTEAAAATAQYSAEIVEGLAPVVKDMLDAVINQDLDQLRQDIAAATDLLDTVKDKVEEAKQAATDASGSALQADQSETAAEAALAETWTAYSAVLDEKETASADFKADAEGKVEAAVTAQLNPGGDFYSALNTAVYDTIPNTVKNNADEYVTELTTEGGSLYNYIEDSKAEIASAKEEAIESIGEKVDADITAKINPEYISEKVNAVLPGLIDEELADADGAWNTAKNEAIELAKQWAISDTHVDGTSYSGARGYMLMAAGLADAAAQSESTAVDAASRASISESNADASKTAAANSAAAAKASEDNAKLYSVSASNSASSAEVYSINASDSATSAAASENKAYHYMEVAEAFAINDYEEGFIIKDTPDGPVVERAPVDQGYSSARIYAYSARDFANNAHSDADTAGRYMQMAYSWAALETTFSYNSNDAASARMWAEAEDPFQLNEVEHESAKAWTEKAATAYSNTVEAYEGTLNAYEGTLNAYSYTKAAVGEAETYLTDVNAVKNTIEQTLISSNWTANNIPVDDSGAFTVTPGLVYAVWSKEVCEIYKDAALENKLCTIWAEEQRCILATQETYYVSPVEQAASVIITSVQYTQPSA